MPNDISNLLPSTDCHYLPTKKKCVNFVETLIEMIAIGIIDNLNSQIPNFLNGTYEYDYLPDKEFERQMDDLYTESTEGVIRRLKKYLLIATKDDCDTAKSRLRKGLAQLQDRLKTLRFYAEDVQLKAKEGVEGVKHLQAKIKFCERISKFYKRLMPQVDEWSEGALTSEETKGCFLAPLKQKYSPNDLSYIYENLVARRYIDGRQTSEGDFIYYFTGDGLHPTHPIKWMKSNLSLAILLNELTDDGDKWSKATAIFTIYSEKERAYIAIGRKSLCNQYGVAKSNGTDAFFRKQEEIQERILTPPQEQWRRVSSRWE